MIDKGNARAASWLPTPGAGRMYASDDLAAILAWLSVAIKPLAAGIESKNVLGQSPDTKVVKPDSLFVKRTGGKRTVESRGLSSSQKGSDYEAKLRELEKQIDAIQEQAVVKRNYADENKKKIDELGIE